MKTTYITPVVELLNLESEAVMANSFGNILPPSPSAGVDGLQKSPVTKLVNNVTSTASDVLTAVEDAFAGF